MATKTAKLKKQQRQLELLSLFSPKHDHYEEKQLSDKVYVKMWNGDTEKWQVAEFTLQSFRRYKSFSRPHSRPRLEDIPSFSKDELELQAAAKTAHDEDMEKLKAKLGL